MGRFFQKLSSGGRIFIDGVSVIKSRPGYLGGGVLLSAIARGVRGDDTTAPVIQTIAIPSAGTTVVLTYNESLDESSVPAITDYTFTGGDSAIAVDTAGVAVSGTTVTLTLDRTVSTGEAVIYLSYTAGANPIRDVAENEALDLTTNVVTNNSTQGTATETVTEAAGGTVKDGEEFIVTTTTILPDPITSVTINSIACTSVTRDGDYQLTATAPTDDLLHNTAYTMEII